MASQACRFATMSTGSFTLGAIVHSLTYVGSVSPIITDECNLVVGKLAVDELNFYVKSRHQHNQSKRQSTLEAFLPKFIFQFESPVADKKSFK